MTPQVIIEARIVEVNTDFSRALGVDWSMTGGPVQKDSLGGAYIWDVAMNFPVASDATMGFVFNRVAGTPLVIDAQLTAIETQ